MLTKTFSLVKLYFDFSEPSSIEASSPGPGFGLPSPILPRILLSQFRQHLPPLISSHTGQSLVRILLKCFSKNHPYPWCPLLVIFHPLAPASLLLGYTSNCLCCICNSAQSLSPIAKVLTPMAKVLSLLF